jgi:hypothetical protein
MKKLQEEDGILVYYLEMVRNGKCDDDAFHGLLEASVSTPRLTREFGKADDDRTRNFLLSVISERRDPGAISFYHTLLNTSYWPSGVEALCKLSSPDAVSVLRKALDRHYDNPKDQKYFQEYLREAIDQIEESINRRDQRDAGR